MIFKMNSYIPIQIYRFIFFPVEAQCVLCKVRIEYLFITYIKYIIQRVKYGGFYKPKLILYLPWKCVNF